MTASADLPTVFNLFADLPDHLDAERADILARWPGARVERILSMGQSSPPGFWYDQSEDEWVMLVRGAARLRFADPDGEVALAAGEAVHVRAHHRHRVEWTDPERICLWLAVFISSP